MPVRLALVGLITDTENLASLVTAGTVAKGFAVFVHPVANRLIVTHDHILK